jgi:uncharacterized protein (TIGR02302 family)
MNGKGRKHVQDQGIPDKTGRHIRAALRLTWAGMVFERLARAFWPFWVVFAALVASRALDLTGAFGLTEDFYLYAAWAVVAVLALAYGIWRLRWPRRPEALARLDAQFTERPLAMLADTQALGRADPAARGLWAVSRDRMAALAARARPIAPDAALNGRDPFALRHVGLVLVLAAVLFGSFGRMAGLTGDLPAGPAGAAIPGPAWEGWAEPPPYTGKPALYLNEQTADVLTLPKGTRFRLRFYGEPGVMGVSQTLSAQTAASDQAPKSGAEFVLNQSGSLAITGPGGWEWEVAMQPDQPPTIAVDGEAKRLREGKFDQGFIARDDFGLSQASASIALDLAAVDRRYGLTIQPEPVTPVVLDMPLPRRGSKTEVKARLTDDMSKHVFANLPVTIVLTAIDASGQTGRSEPVKLVLPGRRFFDPMAAAVIEMRRDLLWNRANAPRNLQVLRAVTWNSDGLFRNAEDLARMKAILVRLSKDDTVMSDKTRDDLAEEMWQLALTLEEGDLNSARERLERAQDRLDEAIRRGADPAEIEELMTEMREAFDEYLERLAEEQGEEDDKDQIERPDQNSMTMNHDQLQQMFDELERLMAEGKTAEAAELMERLRQFMENMKVTEGEGGPGSKSMKKLGEAMRRQQDLSDDAFREMQDGQQDGQEGQQQGENQGQEPGQQQPGQQQPGQQPGDQSGQGQEGADGRQGQRRPGQGTAPGEGEGEGQSLSDRQAQIRRELKGLGRDGQLPGAGSEKGEAGRRQLDEAGRAMEEAEQALRDGDLGGALDRQAEAMEALRQGLRDLGQAMTEENRTQGQASRQTDADAPEGEGGSRDPLGRPGNDVMTHGSDGNLAEDLQGQRRAQELLDEIRRRSGEFARPEDERSYLKRLMELF